MLLQAGCGASGGPEALVVDAAGSPKVTIPSGPPPKKLIVKDLKLGTGPVLGRRGTISTRYVAYDYRTGKVREDHWKNEFGIYFGPGWETHGWERGMPGMRVGGLRELIVPSRLAYKDGTILYVVKLVGLK
jgi:peptidylprolyl isomerase